MSWILNTILGFHVNPINCISLTYACKMYLIKVKAFWEKFAFWGKIITNK